MTPSPKVLSSFLYLSLAAIAGCGDESSATEPGQPVLVANATAFAVISSGGGFVVPAPQGAACDPQIWTYTVRIATSELAWDRCDVVGDATDPASYTHAAASRVLPAGDLADARATARQVHVSDRTACGADKPTYHMSVTSPAGNVVYGDDFYACQKADRAYVIGEELDNLSAKLRLLAQP